MILKLAYKFVPIIYPLAKIYWHIRRPKTTGTKVIIQWQDKILLVKNTYGTRKWSLPGGGILKGEDILACAMREVREEVGIKLTAAHPKGSFYWTGLGKKDTVWVFTGRVQDPKFKLQSEEIQDARWFPLKKLPRDLSETLTLALKKAHLAK